MSCFSAAVNKTSEFKTIEECIKLKRLPMGVIGLAHIHKVNFLEALTEKLNKKAVVITPDEAEASRLVNDLKVMGKKAFVYPARDFCFSTSEAQSHEYEHIRLGVLSRILKGDFDIVVASAEAASQFTIPAEELTDRTLQIKTGESIGLENCINALIKAGYTRSTEVDGTGLFSVRGGILDFFPPSYDNPVRVEFWGDEIDTMAYFDIETQRRTDNINSIDITPVQEILFESNEVLAEKIENLLSNIKGKGSVKMKAHLNNELEKLKSGISPLSTDKYLPLAYQKPASLFDYIFDSMLIVSDSFNVKEKLTAAEKLLYEEIKALLTDGVLASGLDTFSLNSSQVIAEFERKGAIYFDNLARGSFDTPVRELVTVTASQISPWNGSTGQLIEDLSVYKNKQDTTCVVMAGTEKSAKALSEDLIDEGLNCVFFPEYPKDFPKGMITVIPNTLSGGFEYPRSKFVLFTYGARLNLKAHTKQKKKSNKNAFNSLDELHRGDYVVHNQHGIGIFEGIQKLEASGTIKDYIKIKYDKGDLLYVPVTQLDIISKYIGTHSEDGKGVKLSKLGGKDWSKAKAKVKKAVVEMAQELIELYSKRMKVKGHAFSPDIDMQNDFERRFEFEETEDQLRCIDEIKNDMEKPQPMDRLLCGDVGFGKTEVALRGAFKCVADSCQCAILVPTTILALQHYQTLQKRFEGFPVEIRMLSRFVSAKEQAQTVKDLKRGTVDIVVGTHKLLNKSLEFKNLGLLIVDEEQRFGVAQKEKLKEMFPAVDVLTLSATPIPRTLNMAMTGIRDMSVIEEAPGDRHPVQTYVIEHDEEVLVQAMQKELRRGGQVYYLHNRVETIMKKAAEIKNMMPDATVVVAHGKMDEDELSDVWRRLLEGEIDILVCTTIIETGVDVPNVNTLIIENADKMGLAQLHQIRGRVGRSARRASAYFTFTKGKMISDVASRRLEAIREFTQFGSGFKIAMRDLEIRGAGNVLGAQQHGHMESVGYDMYLKLLAQAVNEESGNTEAAEEEPECLIDLPIDAHIPESYINNIPHKLAMYRRIAEIRTVEDADDVIDELIDRFGEPPESVMGLIKIAQVRNTAARIGVYEIGNKNGNMLFYTNNIDMKDVSRLSLFFRGRIMINTKDRPYILIKKKADELPLETVSKAIEVLAHNQEL